MGLSESNDSELCIQAVTAIREKNNKELRNIISNPAFDINERFDTSYMQRENYLNYSIRFRNYKAAKMLLAKDGLQLSKYEKKEILNNLSFFRKYLLLYNLIKRFNEEEVLEHKLKF